LRAEKENRPQERAAKRTQGSAMINNTLTQPEAVEMPSALRCEQAVLGALIEDEDFLPSILVSGLTADDFLLSDHGRIFRAILKLREQNAPVDSVSVAEALGGGQAEFVLIGALISGAVVEASHAAYHAKVVQEKARLRKVLKIGEWLQGAAADRGANPEALVSTAITKLQGVCR
jgi:replicative DNA helicase